MRRKSGITLYAKLEIELRVESLTWLTIGPTTLCKVSHKQITGRHKIIGRNTLLTLRGRLEIFLLIFISLLCTNMQSHHALSLLHLHWTVPPHSPLCELWAYICAITNDHPQLWIVNASRLPSQLTPHPTLIRTLLPQPGVPVGWSNTP